MGLPRHFWLIGLLAAACGRTAEVTVALDRPLEPDPFFGVDRVRLSAVADGERLDLGAWRWDRGPVELDQPNSPTFERLVVVGVDAEGREVASGVSAPLDVVREPPDGPVRVYFSAIGRLSRSPLQLEPRRGGFAASVPGGVVWGGGLDEAGCARSDVVEVDRALRVVAQSRTSSARVSARATGGELGSVLLTEGLRSEGCDPPSRDPPLLVIRVEDRVAEETPWLDGAYPGGAAVAALSENAFVVAGGTGDAVARTDVVLVSSGGGPVRLSTIGQLDRPRTEASALRLSSTRALFVGGRASTSTRTLITDASTFDVSSGRTVASNSIFAVGRAGLAHARLASGALLFAGGKEPDGPSTFLGAVALDPDASGAVSPATSLGDLAAPGSGALLDLRDGSLLFVPEDPADDLTWIRLLPASVSMVPRPESTAGRLTGGVLEPGLALLFGEDGSTWTFHSGPAGPVQATAPLISEPAEMAASGLVPSDPSAVELDDQGLVVRGPDLSGLDLLPEQLVLLTPEDVTDFELTVSYRNLAPRTRPSIVYGFAEQDYDHIVLQASPLVIRSPARRGSGRVQCDPVNLPQLPAVGPHRVRLRRSGGGRRLALDLGADGTEELRCDTPIPRSGAIALGVVSGRVAFDDVRLRIR